MSQRHVLRSKTLKLSYVAMVQCLRCWARISIEVDGEALNRLQSYERLRRACDRCQQETEWQYLPLGVSR